MAGKKKTVPKGYHLMPNGKLMKDSAHKGSARHGRKEMRRGR